MGGAGLEMISLKFWYLLYRIAPYLKLDRQKIADRIISINNKLLKGSKHGFEYDEILVLLPHCIQDKDCKFRITHHQDNCIMCGKCHFGEILKYCKEKGINLRIATGGTLARKIIKELRPKGIVAVACHRDLIEGISDVKKIPVLALTNIIGKCGPCISTGVDTKKLFDLIEKLHKKHI
ncbi:MAG: hypothetical protein C0601_13510 [Candidatus Muiribacterium halophilum]|uniref:DUF116 domain-containing protein n=1 Tax=Muiribacterium halophilum TaxID=2053465 RepID=A0A2N5Z9B2_MUIH1|nr:MAG: hypothetical protein C0601_13510 [Candidatus Muirbacterium halophilum]